MAAAYVYVAELACGRLKVGATRRPRQRRVTLQRQFGRVGRMHAVQCQCPGDRKAEAAVLHRMARIGRHAGGEVFVGISYEAARQLIRQVAPRDHRGVSVHRIRQELYAPADDATQEAA